MKFKLLTEKLTYKQSVLDAADLAKSSLDDFILELADVDDLSAFIHSDDIRRLNEAARIIANFRDNYDMHATVAARSKNED